MSLCFIDTWNLKKLNYLVSHITISKSVGNSGINMSKCFTSSLCHGSHTWTYYSSSFRQAQFT